MCTARPIPEIFAMSATAKDAVLRELASGPSRPTELLDKLQGDFSDFAVKEAILHLLQDGTVVLTSGRQLELVKVA